MFDSAAYPATRPQLHLIGISLVNKDLWVLIRVGWSHASLDWDRCPTVILRPGNYFRFSP
jgi:hypothetical protein